MELRGRCLSESSQRDSSNPVGFSMSRGSSFVRGAPIGVAAAAKWLAKAATHSLIVVLPKTVEAGLAEAGSGAKATRALGHGRHPDTMAFGSFGTDSVIITPPSLLDILPRGGVSRSNQTQATHIL